MAEASVVAVIPARYASSRFPGKPLALIAGRMMIERVYERAASAHLIDRVIVATDDRRIAAAVAGFGGEAVMTSPDHQTGTDRIAEAVAGMHADYIINIQGDEPLMPPAVLDDLVDRVGASGAEMGTVAVPFRLTERDPDDPNAVKVVVDAGGYALYFSRSRIPYLRQGGEAAPPLLHWGVYAYRSDFLEQFVTWPRGALERCEMLEQLRALEHGARIMVIVTDQQSIGVDVPEDVTRVERILAQQGE